MSRKKQIGSDKICPICGVQCMESEDVCECGYHFKTGEMSETSVNKNAVGRWVYPVSLAIASFVYAMFDSLGYGGVLTYAVVAVVSLLICFVIRRNAIRKKTVPLRPSSGSRIVIKDEFPYQYTPSIQKEETHGFTDPKPEEEKYVLADTKLEEETHDFADVELEEELPRSHLSHVPHKTSHKHIREKQKKSFPEKRYPLTKTVLCCITALLCSCIISFPFYLNLQEVQHLTNSLYSVSGAISSGLSEINETIPESMKTLDNDTKYHIETIPGDENGFYIVDLDTGKIYEVSKLSNSSFQEVNGDTYFLPDGTYRIRVQSRSSFENLGDEDLR